ncbi:hypothetical protein Goshw_002150, partial [Gossypium schwendimanii]|nr:hypothetical protein [Gossypium schwendimanii]
TGSCIYPWENTEDPTIAEAWVCLKAAIFAEDLGFREVSLEGDALTKVIFLACISDDEQSDACSGSERTPWFEGLDKSEKASMKILREANFSGGFLRCKKDLRVFQEKIKGCKDADRPGALGNYFILLLNKCTGESLSMIKELGNNKNPLNIKKKRLKKNVVTPKESIDQPNIDELKPFMIKLTFLKRFVKSKEEEKEILETFDKVKMKVGDKVLKEEVKDDKIMQDDSYLIAYTY